MKIRVAWVYYTGRWIARETVDFRLSSSRDVTAAKAFTLDGYAASDRAVRKMMADGRVSESTKGALVKIPTPSVWIAVLAA